MAKDTGGFSAKIEHYDAFISYRHLPLDQAVASRLMALLENYRPPRSAGPLSRKKIQRIFMDKAELPINSDLTESLKEALSISDYLIVILTPDYQKSKYCLQEVEYFKSLHGGSMERILPILAKGEPSEVLFDALCHQTKSAGNPDDPSETMDVEFEPICCDIREDSPDAVIKKLKKWEFLRIAAAIYQCPYDRLFQRHKRRQVKRIQCAALALAVLALGAAFGWKILFPDPLSVSIGDRVLFGHYEQDGDAANGKEDLEWIVLNVSGEYALLMTVNAVDAQPFASDLTHTSWEDSYLREWLNGSFFGEAFSPGEQKNVKLSTVSRDTTILYEARSESALTEDKVYVLGFNEISNYIGLDAAEMIASPTPYALGRLKTSIIYNEETNGGIYWLRSPGSSKFYQACVYYDGSIFNISNTASCYVRPVIQADLRAGSMKKAADP